MKILLDEMYPPALGSALVAAGFEAVTAREMGLAGRSDAVVFAAAAAGGLVLLTENVADFAQIWADQLMAGKHHPGVLIALSNGFSRRPSGVFSLVNAVRAAATEPLDDRLVYLTPAGP
ncbi:MAG: DUF5615 family PIN-like protein [Actinomycetota bacterium]